MKLSNIKKRLALLLSGIIVISEILSANTFTVYAESEVDQSDEFQFETIQPETNQIDTDLIEEIDSKESPAEESQEEVAPLEAVSEVNGFLVTLIADPGVFPVGSTVVFTPVSSNIDTIEDTLNSECSDDTKTREVIAAVDITVYDADGNEIQPDTSKGGVSVSFAPVSDSVSCNEDTSYEVYHVSDDLSEAEIVSSVSTESAVFFEAAHFSLYILASTATIDPDVTGIVELTPEEFSSKVVSSVSITDKNGNPINGSSKINSGDKIVFNYELKDIVAQKDTYSGMAFTNEVYAIKADKTYTLSAGFGDSTDSTVNPLGLPENLLVATGGISVPVKTSDNIKLGIATLTETGAITFTVDSAINETNYKNDIFEEASFGFEVTMDLTKVSDGDKFVIGGGVVKPSFTITLKDLTPQLPTLKKDVSTALNADNEIEWKITITKSTESPHNLYRCISCGRI